MEVVFKHHSSAPLQLSVGCGFAFVKDKSETDLIGVGVLVDVRTVPTSVTPGPCVNCVRRIFPSVSYET